jgi:hypothetical protein
MARSSRAHDAFDLAEPLAGEDRDREDEPAQDASSRAFWFSFDDWRAAPRDQPAFVLA